MHAHHLAQRDRLHNSHIPLLGHVDARTGAQPGRLLTTTLRPQQLSPLSSGSTAPSCASSGPGSALIALNDGRRRSVALDHQLQPDLDDATRLSLQRATNILRASEREREREKDKHRSISSLRCREPVFTAERPPTARRAVQFKIYDEHFRDSNSPHLLLRDGYQRSPARFSPKEFLLRPAPSRGRRTIGSPKALSPSSPCLGRPQHSSVAVGQSQYRATSKDRPPGRGTVETAANPAAPWRPHNLPPLVRRPLARKESLGHPSMPRVVAPDPDESMRKDGRAPSGSFARTTGGGLKSFRTRLGRRASMNTSDNLAVKKKSSLANIFGFGGNDSSASETRRPPTSPDADTTSTKHPLSSSGTSGHRPSTSLSSYAPSTSTSGSALDSRGSSRRGFFRSFGRKKSDAIQRSSVAHPCGHSSPLISVADISAPIPLSPSRSQPLHAAPASPTRAESPAEENTSWRARIGRAIQGKNVAEKRALFEKNAQDSLLRAAAAADSADLTFRPPPRSEVGDAPGRVIPQGSASAAAGHETLVKSHAAAFDALAIQSSSPRVRPRMRAALASMRAEPHTPPRSDLSLGIPEGPCPAGSSPIRHLLPPTPSGSPEKDARGLPVPSVIGPKRVRAFDSPQRHALGPEYAVRVQEDHAAMGPMTRVRGATTDLADLLGTLEDTQDLDKSPRKDDTGDTDWPRNDRYLPPFVQEHALHRRQDEMPGDLYSLIYEVDDRLYGQLEDMAGRGFADEPPPSSSGSSASSCSSSFSGDEDLDNLDQLLPAPHSARVPPTLLLAPPCNYTTQFLSEDGDPTRVFEPTRSSFEEHCSTAAVALRRMLSTGDNRASHSPSASATLQAFAPPPSATLRPLQLWGGGRGSPLRSADAAHELARPSAGEKMFQLIDMTVPLAPLASRPSASPPCLQRSHGSTQPPDSPTPSPSGGLNLRESLVRYSQDGQFRRRQNHGRHSATGHSVESSEHSLPIDVTNHSLALSSQSTKLSIASVQSSPCPAPRQRHVPMLTSHSGCWLGLRIPLDSGHVAQRAPVPEASPSQEQFPSTPSQHSAVLEHALFCSPDQVKESNLIPELRRLHCLFANEAETELKRSLALWPDTDFSSEMVACFVVPQTYFGILEFLVFSLHYFPSTAKPGQLRGPTPCELRREAAPAPRYSIDAPQILRDSPPPQTDNIATSARSLVLDEAPKSGGRPTRKALLDKSTNAPVIYPMHDKVRRGLAGEKASSPFTTLPPRLNLRKSAVSACNTDFLGSKVTRRRQGQLDAAMRRLEGVGAPDEQKSGGETDDTGVLEAEGEATHDLSFSRSPCVASVRPRVRPRMALSMIR